MSLEESRRLVAEHNIRHIAYIMDGNGRWAKKRGLPREIGHIAGKDAFDRVVTYTVKTGVRFVTLYAFSTENWKRSQREVNALMRLFLALMRNGKKDLDKRDIRLVFLGDKSAFKPSMVKRMEELEEYSKDHTFVMNVALNYGGRAEILHAVNTLLEKGEKNVTEEQFSSCLYSALSPDPDVIVRTAGEQRLSNFLLWQAAYSEFYFTDKYWPDMGEQDVDDIILAISKRERRFGGVPGEGAGKGNDK